MSIEDMRLNELYGMVEEMKRAYIDEVQDFELETDNEEAYCESGSGTIIVMSDS